MKKEIKKNMARMTEVILRKELKSSSNSTACGFMYQQNIPEKIAKYRKEK